MTRMRAMRASPEPAIGGFSIEPSSVTRERRTMTSAVPLQLVGISKSFGSVQALRPMTQTIEGGEMLALLGPSGFGKTTTLRLVARCARHEPPRRGTGVRGPRALTELPRNKRCLRMVVKSAILYPHMTYDLLDGFRF